jgi:hypothetical protein
MHSTYPTKRKAVTFSQTIFFFCQLVLAFLQVIFASTNESQARLFLNFIVLYTKQGERSKQFFVTSRRETQSGRTLDKDKNT